MGGLDEIRTDRLLLRRWRDSDRPAFADLNADPEVMRFFPATLDRAKSDAAVDRFERLFDRQGYGLWALEVRESGAFIGFCGLNRMPDGVPGAGDLEVGWRLASSAWHQGYATEAARAVVQVGLEHLGLTTIWSMTAVLNTPSQAVMQRLGMVRHGTCDHPRVPVGHPLRPHVVYRTGGDRTSPVPASQLSPGPSGRALALRRERAGTGRRSARPPSR